MPPRLRTGAVLLQRVFAENYICPSCVLRSTRSSQAVCHSTRPETHANGTWNSSTRGSRPSNPHLGSLYTSAKGPPSPRFSSESSAPATAIDPTSVAPSARQELHQRLVVLQEKAAPYVDLSRLQLAIRSLESEDPVIRVAFLGLGKGGVQTARKLLRVLLSDALVQEATWEQQILGAGAAGQTLVVRYGELDEAVQKSPLVNTMSIPSPFLQRNNLEILVADLSSVGDESTHMGEKQLEKTVLVPLIATPTTAGGRTSHIGYPVHKAVIVTEGVIGAIEFGRYSSTVTDGGLVTAALNAPSQLGSAGESIERGTIGNTVDVDLATEALNLFRQDRANGAEFGQKWQQSRVGRISDWLIPSAPGEKRNRLEIVGLVSSLLSGVSTTVAHAEVVGKATAAQLTASEDKRTMLQVAISNWSSEAHRDLQSNLAKAFASTAWRRTVWWRLLWRIDDVSISAADVLRQSWLREAEQKLAFLCGCMYQSGIATEEQLKATGIQLQISETRKIRKEAHELTESSEETPRHYVELPSLFAKMEEQSGVNALFDPPWPQTINLSRQYIIRTLVPDLHRKAQELLLKSLTTTGGAAALGTWFYIATSGIAMYESGAIVALGLVWSLRYLQKIWSKEREDFAATIREDGRRVLADLEDPLRQLVKEGGRAEIPAADTLTWKEAKDAVEECQRALESARQLE